MEKPVCLVTGASSGIGQATAVGLARLGRDVVLLCRDAARGEEARSAILRAVPGARAELLLADLSSRRQVRRAADEYRARVGTLSVLVNNAGVYHQRRVLTEDGLEGTFAVNHIGYFLLTSLLLDLLKASAGTPGGGRIVNVASQAHRGARLRFDDLQMERDYNGIKAYGKSKLANLLFTYELARRLDGTGVTANALHPGVIASGLVREAPQPFRFLWGLVFESPEKGARTSLHLAASPEVEGVTGKYFLNAKEHRSSPESYDREAARRLWEVSERLTGIAGGS